MARPGRRPGKADTRQEILDAARAAFAADGFGRTTIRRIASDAGVDPALVHHYFGTKSDLYAATIELGISPSVLSETLKQVPPDELGRHVVGMFFSVWGNPEIRARLLAILGGAMTGHEAGLGALREFLAENLLDGIVHLLDGDDRELRATLAASHLVGAAIVRYVVRLEPLASATEEEIIDLVSPAIQRYFDGDGDEGEG
jgi:AcrR family transcriptional regulator